MLVGILTFLLDSDKNWLETAEGVMSEMVEMQNTGDSSVKADVVASIEHAVADRSGLTRPYYWCSPATDLRSERRSCQWPKLNF